MIKKSNHVIPSEYEGGWAIKKPDAIKVTKLFDRKEDAIKFGRTLIRKEET